MTDLVERLRSSDGFTSFIAGDGHPAIKADTDLMNEAADRIEELERLTEYANDVITRDESDYAASKEGQ